MLLFIYRFMSLMDYVHDGLCDRWVMSLGSVYLWVMCLGVVFFSL